LHLIQKIIHNDTNHFNTELSLDKGSFRLVAKRVAVQNRWDFGATNLSTDKTMPASDTLGKPLKPQCFMTAC